MRQTECEISWTVETIAHGRGSAKPSNSNRAATVRERFPTRSYTSGFRPQTARRAGTVISRHARPGVRRPTPPRTLRLVLPRGHALAGLRPATSRIPRQSGAHAENRTGRTSFVRNFTSVAGPPLLPFRGRDPRRGPALGCRSVRGFFGFRQVLLRAIQGHQSPRRDHLEPWRRLFENGTGNRESTQGE